MKKNLFFLGLAFLGFNLSNAQCEPVATLDENFDDATTLEDICWSSSSGAPFFLIEEEDGNQFAQIYSFMAGTASLYLVSPELIEINGQTLTFTAKNQGGNPTIQVGTLAVADDFTTFTAVGEVIELTSDETEYSVVIPATTDKFIAFKYNADGNHVAGNIDNVVFDFVEVNCDDPVSSLNETFDEGPLPACWSSSHSYPNIMGTDNATFYAGSSPTAEIYLVSPEITEFNGQQTLSFTAAGTSMSPVLQVGTLAVADDFDTFVAVGDEIALGEEDTYSISIPASETQKFIAFKFNAGGSPHAAGNIDNVVFQATASVGQIEQNSFRIYPNPVSSVLNINGNAAIQSIEIFDMTGRKVLVSNAQSIDVSLLNNGTYILNITSELGTTQSRFIKK